MRIPYPFQVVLVLTNFLLKLFQCLIETCRIRLGLGALRSFIHAF